jgi:hypothetical protein
MRRHGYKPLQGYNAQLAVNEQQVVIDYGRYYRTQMYPLLRRVNLYLRRWAGRKYRRLRTHKRFKRWWYRPIKRDPGLLAHWQWVYAC